MVPVVHGRFAGEVRKDLIRPYQPVQHTGYQFGLIVLVWGEEIGKFPVERPAFGTFQPADGDGTPLMALFQPDPQAGISVSEIAATVGAVGYIPAFNKKYLNPHCKIDHTLI